MKKFIALYILAVGSISCTPNDDAKINNSDLIGTWNWTNTDGGLTNHIHETPTSAEKIIHLSLMENYTYSITENGNEITTGTYKLTMKKSIYSGEMLRFIQYSENKNAKNIVINGIITISGTNKLDISDNNYDGIASGFEKME